MSEKEDRIEKEEIRDGNGKKEGDDTFDIVLSYKKLCEDSSKHKVIIKDKTMVQFLAYSLDSNDENIVEASLETLDLLIQNRNNHYDLRNTFGMMESILAASKRPDIRDKTKSYAQRLHTCLESSGLTYTTPLPQTPLAKTKRKSMSSITLIYTFHVFGLNEDLRCDLEECIVRVRGVISVVVDISHQRVLVRVIPDGPTPETIIKTITSNTTMRPVLIIKNSRGQELLKMESVDIVDDEDLPDYLPEEESPVKDKALLSFDRIRSNASSWVRSASAFLQDAFYW